MNPQKEAMYHARNGICDYCGEWMHPYDIECHIHHAVVFKSNVGKAQQKGIDDLINLTLLHAKCHAKAHADRQWGIEFAKALHGEDAVKEYMQEMLPRTWQTLWRQSDG